MKFGAAVNGRPDGTGGPLRLRDRDVGFDVGTLDAPSFTALI